MFLRKTATFNTSLATMSMRHLKTAIYPAYKGKLNDKVAKAIHAEKKWHIYIYVDGKDFKISDGLNRIKDYETKIKAFTALQRQIEIMLEGGWRPNDKAANTKYYNRVKSQNLIGATQLYYEYIVSKRINKKDNKTDKDYKSRLKIIHEIYNDDTLLEDINGFDVLDAIDNKALQGIWSNKTCNNTYTAINSFFNWCIHPQRKYLQENPLTECHYTKKPVGDSETHEPLSDEDMATFMRMIRSNEQENKREIIMLEMIYYTCLRPSEIRKLTLSQIDLNKGAIRLNPMDTKNEKAATILLPEQLITTLKYYGIEKAIDKFNRLLKDAETTDESVKDIYLFSGGCSNNMYGTTMVGRDVIQRKINKMLHDAGHKNSTCYSFKHFANIQRVVKDKWNLADIMVGNRHATIEEASNYMRKIGKYIDKDKMRTVSSL